VNLSLRSNLTLLANVEFGRMNGGETLNSGQVTLQYLF